VFTAVARFEAKEEKINRCKVAGIDKWEPLEGRVQRAQKKSFVMASGLIDSEPIYKKEISRWPVN
jgi:hypothetical protein